MGIKRVIDVSFWQDRTVLEQFTPNDRLVMLYLMCCASTTQLGIYPISLRLIAFETGLSLEQVQDSMQRLESRFHRILYSESTGEVAILNYLSQAIVKGGKPVEDLLIREMHMVQDVSLLSGAFNSLRELRGLSVTVRNIIRYFDNNISQNENENDNDNDNDDSYPESYHESCPEEPSPSGQKQAATVFPSEGLLLSDGTLYCVPPEKLLRFSERYPGIDVAQQLRNMAGWLEAHPTRRKTRKGIDGFIQHWLSNAQDRAKPVCVPSSGLLPDEPDGELMQAFA